MKDITAAAWGWLLAPCIATSVEGTHLVGAEALLAWGSEQFKRESDMPAGRSVDRLKIASVVAAAPSSSTRAPIGHMLAVQASDRTARDGGVRGVFAVPSRCDASAVSSTRVPQPCP